MHESLWPKDIGEAREIQDVLSRKVKIRPLKKVPTSVAGVDAAFDGDTVAAVASLFTFPDGMLIQDVFCREKVRFPYVPGLLTFREGPAMLHALGKLTASPDLILFDGQGIAHPKGIGIASHLGVILDIPAIGCAKSRLVGDFREPGKQKGRWTELRYRGCRIGIVLRTRNNVKPLFVSPGHLIDIDSSREIVMQCITHFRLPEPLRRADHLSKTMKGGQ